MELTFALRARRGPGEAVTKEEILGALGLVERIAEVAVQSDLTSARLEFAHDADEAAAWLVKHPADQFAQLRAAGIQVDIEVHGPGRAVPLSVELLTECALRDLPVTVLPD
jgi:hypothetical protein